MKLSPVALLYSTAAVMMSVCCKYRLVDGLRKSKLTMSYRAVTKSREYWRLGSSLLLFDLKTPLDLYTLVALYTSLAALEQRFFKKAPTGMITTLVFIATLLLAPGFYIRELRLKEPSVMMFVAIVTWATIRCFFNPSLGSSSLVAALGPLIPIAAPHIRQGALDLALLKHQGMAIAAGLACVFLVPDLESAKTLRRQRQKAASMRSASAGVSTSGSGTAAAATGAASSDDSSEDERPEDDAEYDEEDSDE